jgi:hypothetical protein
MPTVSESVSDICRLKGRKHTCSKHPVSALANDTRLARVCDRSRD